MFLALDFLGSEELLAGSKRAMDEDILQIFRSGQQCVVLQSTCEDFPLASPLYLVLAITTELHGSEVSSDGGETFGPTRHVHSVCQDSMEFLIVVGESYKTTVPYLLKAPVVPKGIPVANALNCQKRYGRLQWCCFVCDVYVPHHKRPESLLRVVGE